MKAIVYTQYGGSEMLQIREVEKPLPKDDEVLAKVYAVSINDWDFGLLQGDFVKPNKDLGYMNELFEG